MKRKKYPHVLIGPAGTRGQGALKEIPNLVENDLQALEILFTYGVRMKIPTAKKIGKLSKKHDISLSIHAPYYINLSSSDPDVVVASRKRILQCCELGYHLHARYIVFHAAFYSKNDRGIVFENVKSNINVIHTEMAKNGWNKRVTLCPETTGKKSQFGTLDELKRLSDATGCGICVARNNGKLDYDEILPIIKSIDVRTAHFSGVEYNEKVGEVRHLKTPSEWIKKLLKKLFEYDVDLRVINESTQPFKDARRMRKRWKRMTKKKKKKGKERNLRKRKKSGDESSDGDDEEPSKKRRKKK